jgi:hypothetical protein
MAMVKLNVFVYNMFTGQPMDAETDFTNHYNAVEQHIS